MTSWSEFHKSIYFQPEVACNRVMVSSELTIQVRKSSQLLLNFHLGLVLTNELKVTQTLPQVMMKLYSQITTKRSVSGRQREVGVSCQGEEALQ